MLVYWGNLGVVVGGVFVGEEVEGVRERKVGLLWERERVLGLNALLSCLLMV
jgi:hypothetical protein